MNYITGMFRMVNYPRAEGDSRDMIGQITGITVSLDMEVDHYYLAN